LLFILAEPYSLVREDVWNKFRDKVRLLEDLELKDLVLHSWLNPNQKRPESVIRCSHLRRDDKKIRPGL
jgi:hypothetical protein